VKREKRLKKSKRGDGGLELLDKCVDCPEYGH